MATIVVSPPPVELQPGGAHVPGGVLVVPITGPQGPPGAPGAGFTHTQASPAATWIVTHNLGLQPGVSVQVGGEQVIADVIYSSLNVVTIVFASPQSGFARLA